MEMGVDSNFALRPEPRPVSNVQTGVRRATFSGVIWVRGLCRLLV